MSYEIDAVDARIIDLPIRREHVIGVATMSRQSSVIVQVRTKDGLTGVGEGVVPGGGPEWGGESVESIKVTIDRYLAPAITDVPLRGINDALHRMGTASAGNHFAKAAIDMALWDILGKRAACPVHELLGGLQRDRIDVLWSIGASIPDPLEEAERFLDAGHRTLKFMIGGIAAPEAVARVTGVLEKLPSHITTIVDANGRWDEPTARRWLPVLSDAGVDIAEQLVPAWNIAAMSRLTGLTRTWTMADESVRSVFDAQAVAQRHAADVIAVKLPKLGGIAASRDVAGIARSAGLRCYGGGTMETSIGTSAAAHVFGTLPDLAGSDIIGPIMLADDIVTQPLTVEDGAVLITHRPGLGVDLDEDKVRRYMRESR